MIATAHCCTAASRDWKMRFTKFYRFVSSPVLRAASLLTMILLYTSVRPPGRRSTRGRKSEGVHMRLCGGVLVRGGLYFNPSLWCTRYARTILVLYVAYFCPSLLDTWYLARRGRKRCLCPRRVSAWWARQDDRESSSPIAAFGFVSSALSYDSHRRCRWPCSRGCHSIVWRYTT